MRVATCRANVLPLTVRLVAPASEVPEAQVDAQRTDSASGTRLGLVVPLGFSGHVSVAPRDVVACFRLGRRLPLDKGSALDATGSSARRWSDSKRTTVQRVLVLCHDSVEGLEKTGVGGAELERKTVYLLTSASVDVDDASQTWSLAAPGFPPRHRTWVFSATAELHVSQVVQCHQEGVQTADGVVFQSDCRQFAFPGEAKDRLSGVRKAAALDDRLSLLGPSSQAWITCF